MEKVIFERIKSNSSNIFSKKERSFLYKTKEELPKQVRLEACTLCQLNCVACWMRLGAEEIKKTDGFGYLRFKDFKKFVDDNPQIESIELSNNGEIFLNPELDEIIKYAYEKKIVLTAYNGVNLNTLSDKTAEILVKYQFREMTVSIDGATPDVYKIYRRGGDLNKVIVNIKKINEYKKKYNSEFPILTYKFIVFSHNIEDIPLAKKLAKELNMYIKFDQNSQTWYDKLSEEQKIRAEKLSGEKFEETTEKFYLEKYKKNNSKYFFCLDLFEKPQIDWNGKLLGCCFPTTSKFNVNVFKQGLFKSLNNIRVLYVKRMLTDFSVPPKEGFLCTDCTVYKLLKEENFELFKNKNV
ncbi:MAG: radical SAM protein [bacterium]|nr:radical SAM protein [bacterium]